MIYEITNNFSIWNITKIDEYHNIQHQIATMRIMLQMMIVVDLSLLSFD